MIAVILSTVNVFAATQYYCKAWTDTECGQVSCSAPGSCFAGEYKCDRGCDASYGWVECTYNDVYVEIQYNIWCSAHCDVLQ